MASALLRERLPPDFHIGVTQDGRIFFINDRNQTTSWLHPASGEPVLTGLSQKEDLPRGWEEDYTNEGQVFYVDHTRWVTTFEHPLQGDNHRQTNQQHHQNTQDYPPSSSPHIDGRGHQHRPSEAPPQSPTSPGSPTLQRDAFKRGTFKQRSVKAPTAKRNPNSEVVKRGWLYKLESGGLSKSKNWKKRWAVLADFALFIYKGEEEASVVTSILLPGYRINPCTQEDNIKRNFVFKVEHENTKSVYLGTEDSPELLSWMSLLRQASMMNGQAGFQREPNNNYRRYPSKETGNSNDKQQQQQHRQNQQQSQRQPGPHYHQDPNTSYPNPQSDYSFQPGGSNYSPSSNPSFQKLQNFRPYNQTDTSPTDPRVIPPSSQGQSPSYQDYNNDPASSPMEPQPPARVGGVYPFINQQGQRQSYVSQGSSNRDSYAPPTSSYPQPASNQGPPSSNNSRQYSVNPENDFNDYRSPHNNSNQPKWQDSLEERNRMGSNDPRDYVPMGPRDDRQGYYPRNSHNKPLRDGFAPDSVRSSLAQPEQRFSYSDGRPMDHQDPNLMHHQQQQPNMAAGPSSDLNRSSNSQHNYSLNNSNFHPNESNQNLALNLSRNDDSFYKPASRLSQSSRDGRQPSQRQNYPQQAHQDISSSPLLSSSSFNQNQNHSKDDFPQNQQHSQFRDQHRHSFASTSSAGHKPNHHDQQKYQHTNQRHPQQPDHLRFNNSYSSNYQPDMNHSHHRDQRSIDNSSDQIHPSSSSALHSSLPLNQSYQNNSHSHLPPHQTAAMASSSPSSSTQQEYNNDANPHTYVNFPNRQQQQIPPPQPPSSLPIQPHRVDMSMSMESSPPSRPPYPAEMRHHIVEEMAKTATPSTQKDFLTSAQINEQRMQQPAFFQYPSPRNYPDARKDTFHVQSSSQNNPNTSFRDLPTTNNNPRFSTASRGSQSSHRGADQRDGGMGTNSIPANHKEPHYGGAGGLNGSFSRNMMDPEANKLRAAYERVHSLRSSPDKSDFNNLLNENDSLHPGATEGARLSHQPTVLSPAHRGYKSQDELDGAGKTPPPTGSYHKIRDDSEDLYMRGSAFRPPSSMSGSQAGSESLMRMKRKFHSSTTLSQSPTNYDKREDLRLVGAASEDDLLCNRERDGYQNAESRRNNANINYYNVGIDDFSSDPWSNNDEGKRNVDLKQQKQQGVMDREVYDEEHPFFDPYGSAKGMRQQTQELMEKREQKPILLAAPPRRKAAPIQTVKEDPDMPDRDVLETDLQKVAAKNPLNGPRLRMSICADDLIGKTHDELVLLLIQLRRNQAALDKTRDFYRVQIDQLRPAELEYRRQMHQYGNVNDGALHNTHRTFTDAKTQMEEIENKLEVYRPIINLLDNMVTMGSLYGGDNLMLATQYRKHLLRPDQYQAPKKMLDFTRQNQEDRLVQGTHEDIKQLSKDEVDLEDKIDRLNQVDRAVQEQSFKVSSFKEDKELMEKALVGILRQQDQNRNDPREMHRLTQQQRTLEKEISRVTQQLAEASKELEATSAENNKLEHEIALLRTKVHGELSRSRSAPSLASENIRTKMKMEKELAKVQDMMHGLNQKGAKLSQAMNTLRRSSSGTNIAAALDDEQTKPSGTYMQTDMDSGEQVNLAESLVQEDGTDGYPSVNHHRQSAADDWDGGNDEDTKKFFGLLPRDKPKGQTVRDVKRLSEARKEKEKRNDFGEEISLRVSNVDNEVSSIIHARIAKDTQAVLQQSTASVDPTWDSAGHPLYENLPRYGSMPQLADNNIGTTANNNTNNNNINNNSFSASTINQSAASSRRSSIVLLTPKPFVPYQDKSSRPFRSELALNSLNSSQGNEPFNTSSALSSNGFDYKDSGNNNNDSNNNDNSSGYFTKGKNFNLDRPYHSQDLLTSDDPRPYSDLNNSQHIVDQNERDLEQNGHFHAKPTTIFPKDASPLTNGGGLVRESPITAVTVDRRSESMPGAPQGTLQSSSLFAPRPWVKHAADIQARKIARGRYSTISSSQPLKLESSLLLNNPTLHSSAGDLILNRSIDDIPDIVKSSQGRGEDQMDGDVIDREILSMPDKVLIPERYDAEADAEHLTEDEKLVRQKRSERIRRVLTTQSVMSISQPDVSQMPTDQIHSRVQQEKKERAHYLALNQELARQVTQQSKKQAAERRKTWSGAQFADAKKQYEQEQDLLNVSVSGAPLRSPDPVRKRSELTLRNL